MTVYPAGSLLVFTAGDDSIPIAQLMILKDCDLRALIGEFKAGGGSPAHKAWLTGKNMHSFAAWLFANEYAAPVEVKVVDISDEWNLEKPGG